MRMLGRIAGMVALGAAVTAMADPVCRTTDLIHRWSFNGNLEDSVGGQAATATGRAAFNYESTAIRLKGNGHDTAYVNLGTGIVPAEGGPITIEVWAMQHTERNWSRIIDFGPDDQNYVLMSWSQGTSMMTDAVEVKAASTTLLRADNELQPYNLNVQYHISLTLAPTSDGKTMLTWAKRDVFTGAVLKSGRGTTSAAWTTANIANWAYCCIGRSQFTADSDADATYDEVRIWKTALTEEQLTWSARLGPDLLPTESTSVNSTMTLTAVNGSVSVNGAAAVGSGSVAVPRSPDAVLTAVPSAGYTFVRWTGDIDRILSGSLNSATITVNSARDFALSAEFESADNVVYARYENGNFVYLTPGKGVGNAPQGGMNNGITILFSSDAEYRQLCAIPDEVAKAKGLELGDNVKLTADADWTALDYSLAGYSVDLSGVRLTTDILNGGSGGAVSRELIANGGFDVDPIDDGAMVEMVPRGWSQAEGVSLLKNNTDYGYSQCNGSNWLMVESGGHLQQQFTVESGCVCTLAFMVASWDSESSWRNSSCLIQLDGNTLHEEYTGTWNARSKSYTVPVSAGSHTLKISCNGGDKQRVLIDNVSMTVSSVGGHFVANAEVVVNGDFQGDYVADGGSTAMIPKGWTASGGVYVLKNDKVDGYSNCNGSNWLKLNNGGYVQQQFTTRLEGDCALKFTVASRDSETTWKDSSCYVQIDGESVHNAYTGTWIASTKSYTVHVNAGNHTLRIGCNGGGAVLVDNLSLISTSELVVTVPEGDTLVNDNVHFNGAGLKLVKSGAGTLLQNSENHYHAGGTLVSEGQLKLGNNNCISSAGEVAVDPNGVLEVNGKGDLQAYRFVLNGGTMQNTVSDVGEGTAQITSLRLTADSTFKPTCSYGLIGSGYAATSLDLAGHTLTVSTGDGKSFWLYNATVTAGTLEVTGGGWLVADKTRVNASAADLRADCALDIRVPFTVGSYEAIYGGTANAGSEPLTVQRVFKPHDSRYHGVALTTGASIDLTACHGVLKTPGLFTGGANEIIFPPQEEYTPLEWIESSGTQWIDTGYVCTGNTRIEALINTCTRSQNWGVFFGVTGNDSSSDGVLLRYYNDTTALNGWFCNSDYAESQVEDLQGRDVEVVLEPNWMTLNGVAKVITTTSTAPYASPLYLFCGNNGGAAWRHQSMRLYSMKISEGGVLKRDFVPCRAPNGALGLFDRVEDKFYANQGSGAFTVSDIVTGEPYRFPSTVFVDLHGRRLDTSKIIGWNAIPANVVFKPTEATRNAHYIPEARTNGLYLPIDTVIYFR